MRVQGVISETIKKERNLRIIVIYLHINFLTLILRKYLIILFLLISIQILDTNIYSQEVPQPINNKGIYEFLDELANCQVITINSAIKPYSRLFIARCLKEAEGKTDQLNRRQQKELEFYLRDFGKEVGGRTTHDAGHKEEWIEGAGEEMKGRRREGEKGGKGEGGEREKAGFVLLQGLIVFAHC